MLDLSRQCRGLSKYRDPDVLDSARKPRLMKNQWNQNVERPETAEEKATREYIAEKNRYEHVAVTILHDLYR